MNRIVSIVMNTVVPIAILVSALLAGRALVASREGPPLAERAHNAALVEVVEARAVFERVGVSAQGTVVPARQVTIAPQVTGRVQSVHPSLVEGGIIDEGAELFRIDARDYALTIEQLQAQLAQAEANLELELGRQAVAEQEWALFRSALERDDGDDALATRQPQVRSARVAIESIEAQIRQARLQLSRTTVDAPFRALVRTESVDVGQLVAPGAPVATLVDAERYWVEVAVPFDQLAGISVPGVNADEGSSATVRVSLGERVAERSGRVVRIAGELAATGRMAVLIVEVDDPLGLDEPLADRVPLLLGAFVDVEIEGASSLRAVEIPRIAVREGDRVYVAKDGVLEIRPITIAWGDEDRVLAASGVGAGEQLITSRLGGVTDGMAVRTGDADAPGGDAPGGAAAAGEAEGSE